MRLPALVSLMFCVVVAKTATAQAILGTYTMAPASGGGGTPVTLVLKKDAQGNVGGSLSANGNSFAVQAVMQGDDVAGTLTGGGLKSMFEAHREGARLRMIVADIGADGKPNYSAAREIVLNVSDAAAAAGASTSPSQAGNPPAAGATPDRFGGTFTSTDITLSLAKKGEGYTGTIKYRGTEYPATARVAGESLAGSFKVGAQSYDMAIASTGDGKYVNLSTAGTTYMLARSAATDGNPFAAAAPTASSAPSGSSTSLGLTAQDKQIAQLLISTAWCSFSYSGSATSSSSGRTNTSRSAFTADGWVSETKNSEAVYSGNAGTVYGNNSGGQRGRWKVENGMLMLSLDGVQWVPTVMKIADNGSGAPIITTGGKEYMRCK